MPDPLIGTGISGGPNGVGECGFIDTFDSSDYVVSVYDSFAFLRISVEARGDVTLFMQNLDTGATLGSNDVNGLLPEISGQWLSRWVESFVERAYGKKNLASVGFRSSTATYIICNLITPAYLPGTYAFWIGDFFGIGDFDGAGYSYEFSLSEF